MMARMPTSQPSRRSAGWLIAVGFVLVAAGALALTVAAAHAPTLSNALTQRWVLKPGAYTGLRAAVWVTVVGGALVALTGVLRREQRANFSPPPPSGPPRPRPVSGALPEAHAVPEYAAPAAATAPTQEGEEPHGLWSGKARIHTPEARPVASSDGRIRDAIAPAAARRGGGTFRVVVAIMAIGVTALIVVAVLWARSHDPPQEAMTSGRPSATASMAPGPAATAAATSAPPAIATAIPDDQGLAAAEDIVTTQGYDPIEVVGFDGASDLQMILGHSHGSADGGREWAFFFDPNGVYLGTDASEPTAGLERSWSDGDTIALRYTLFRADDPQCCPSGGATTVRFHWDGDRVNALDSIPSTEGDPSRR
jgi:hypothetical protein